MSDAQQEPRVDSSGRESALGVLLMGGGLFALFVVLAVLAMPFGSDLDAQELLDELMPRGAPAGFEAVSANALPTRETVLLLEAQGEVAQGPEQVVLVSYPSNKDAQADMRGASTPRGSEPGGPDDPAVQLERWQQERNFTMHLTVDQGEVAWGQWRAATATERSLRDDGTWRESIRVNLSQRDRFLVLFAQWPAETHADAEQLKSILGRVAMTTADS